MRKTGEFKPDIILVSSTYDSHFNAVKLSRIAKKIKPNAIIIYGGPHIKEVADDKVRKKMPQVYPFNELKSPFDFLIEGDGEYPILELVRDIIDNKDYRQTINYLLGEKAVEKYSNLPCKSRIHFKKALNEIKILNTSMIPMNLDNLPYLPRHLFQEKDKYEFTCFKNGDGSYMSSTSTILHRGCRGNCIFCSEREQYNERSFAHIIGELEQVEELDYEAVFFNDSTFHDHNDFENLLNLLRSLKLKYGSLNRFDKLADEKIVKKLAEAGFVYQYCAIEQFDNNVLTANYKKQNLNHIEQGMNNLYEYGVDLGVSLLFGLKGENFDSIKRTMEFTAKWIDKGLISYVNLALYCIHPNTFFMHKYASKELQERVKYDCKPPKWNRFPWNSFEEGQWYHPDWVDERLVQKIYELSEEYLSNKLTRNLEK